jgi:hypothetical protein
MRCERCYKLPVAVLFCLLPGLATIAAAQSNEQEPIPVHAMPLEPLPASEPRVIALSQPQIEEVQRWTREYDEWEKWAARWLNRRQPGFWDPALARTKKPDPPIWLEDACELLAEDDQLARPCKLLAAWRDDLVTAKNRQASAAAVVQKEAPTKTSWWRHAHLDAMWSTTQSNVTAFGILGAHLTMEVEGRFQVFVAPGIMLVSVPALSGGRSLQPATDWGVTYRLFNVGRNTVHFNLVHAWLLPNGANLINSQVTLAGFSVSFRPQHSDR